MAMSIDNLQNLNFDLPVTPQEQDAMRWTTLAGQLPGGPTPSSLLPTNQEHHNQLIMSLSTTSTKNVLPLGRISLIEL